MNVPFRWDLVKPDRLGSLLDGVAIPEVTYLAELSRCAGKVLARSGDGDLVFVGRSLDSMFDLLGGALEGTGRGLARLPLSLRGPFTRLEVLAAREAAENLGITPHALARRTRPVTFVDVVSSGSTFGQLFTLLDDWTAEERETWPAIRLKLRFVGITSERDPPRRSGAGSSTPTGRAACRRRPWSTCRSTRTSGRTSVTTRSS
ncbi:hypothetical protein ACFWN2_37180 [Lentzea sp. NPDC058436]|uniref:hypothetical protein n=1 Tax=Lentzea sp. NPDC058436 TaxID=3346499 RepID=UPI00364ACC26